MSMSTNVHLHDDDALKVHVYEYAGTAGLQLEMPSGCLTLFFHGISAADIDPISDAIEQALRKMRGEAEPSFQIAAE